MLPTKTDTSEKNIPLTRIWVRLINMILKICNQDIPNDCTVEIFLLADQLACVYYARTPAHPFILP